MQDSAQLRRLDQVRVRVVAARVEERRVLEEGSAPAGEILRLYGRIAETTSALGHRGRHARKNQSWAESPRLMSDSGYQWGLEQIAARAFRQDAATALAEAALEAGGAEDAEEATDGK